jgi:hypothetical protein
VGEDHAGEGEQGFGGLVDHFHKDEGEDGSRFTEVCWLEVLPKGRHWFNPGRAVALWIC